MQIVIFGASGLVGSHLMRSLSALGVVRGTFFSAAAPGPDRLDITDPARSDGTQKVRAGLLLCAAANPHVDGCERDPSGTRFVNVTGAQHVAEAAGRLGAKLVCCASPRRALRTPLSGTICSEGSLGAQRTPDTALRAMREAEAVSASSQTSPP